MTYTKSTLRETLLLVALLAAAVAYWAPWVWHHSAALKLSGQDLGEFVKFIPETGPTFPRQLFYVPPFVCSLCLVLLAANRSVAPDRKSYPRWLRVGMLACALLLLPGLLPPAWGHPRELFLPEFRLQGFAVLVGALAVLGHGLLRRIPARAMGLVVGMLALLALVLPQAAFWAIRSSLRAVYHTPTIRIGWGLWLHCAAWVGVLAGAWLTISSQAATEEKRPEAPVTF
jgi:hypothetical protein